MTGIEPDLDTLTSHILECLNGIVDPCSVTAGAPAGLADMGLVSKIELEPDDQGGARASIEIGITHPFCMMAGVFINEVRTRVGGMEEISEVNVSLDSDTVWTPSMMTPEYRARLEEVRKAKGVSTKIPN